MSSSSCVGLDLIVEIIRHYHKNTVQALAWSPNGDLVASASRDQTVRVFDIRAMKEFRVLKGHKKEVCCKCLYLPYTTCSDIGCPAVAWHPYHPLLVSGGSEGSILHWDLSGSTSPLPTQSMNHAPGPRATLSQAHDSNVWSLAFHPLGHILVSASNDQTTRFWCRERPGDATSVFSGGGEKPPDDVGEVGGTAQDDDDDQFIPGVGPWGGLKEEDQSMGYNGSMNGSGVDAFGRTRQPPTGPAAMSMNDGQDDFLPGLGPVDASINFSSSSGSGFVAGRQNGPLPSQEDLYGHDDETTPGGGSGSGSGNYGWRGGRGGGGGGGGRRWNSRRRH